MLLSVLGGLFIAVLGWLVALVYALRREMRQEMANLRQEMADLRKEMQAGFEAANRRIDANTARIDANGARIDRLVEQVSLLVERMGQDRGPPRLPELSLPRPCPAPVHWSPLLPRSPS